MTTLVYAKLPFSQIHYLERPEFHNEEKVFKSRLLKSLKEHGIVDPLYAEVGNDYGRYIKIIVLVVQKCYLHHRNSNKIWIKHSKYYKFS